MPHFAVRETVRMKVFPNVSPLSIEIVTNDWIQRRYEEDSVRVNILGTSLSHPVLSAYGDQEESEPPQYKTRRADDKGVAYHIADYQERYIVMIWYYETVEKPRS